MAISVGSMTLMKLGANTLCFSRIVSQTTREVVHNPQGTMCADPDHPANRRRKGRLMVRALVEIDLTGPVIEFLLPKLGITDNTGGVFTLEADDTLTEFDIEVDAGGAIHLWGGCVVAQWAIRASRGTRPVQIMLEVIGSTETEPAGPLTKAPLAIGDIFAFTDLGTGDFTVGGTLRPIDRFVLQVNNGAVPEWNASVTRTDVAMGERTAIMAFSSPYVSTQDDLYWTFRDSDNGIAVASIQLNNGTKTLTFDAANCTPVTGDTPSITGKSDQIRCPCTLLLNSSDNVGTRVTPLTITYA